jgi:hypothetical protein
MNRPTGWRAPGSRVGRPHGRDRRTERRIRAEERHAARAARSTTAQLALLATRRGSSKRETTRLQAAFVAQARRAANAATAK